MQTINSLTDLREAIFILEMQRNDEANMLREKFHLAIDSMQPVNLIKSTFKDVVSSPDLPGHLLSTSAGLATGMLTRIVISSITKNPVKRLIGRALMYGLTNLAMNNPETVKSLGKGIIKIVRGKQEDRVYPK